jgi:hypothetical protein
MTRPVGSAGKIGDRWSITVIGTVEDPKQIDPTAGWFNSWLDQNPPPQGHQYFTVRLRITNLTPMAATPFSDLKLSLVARTGFQYDAGAGCGTVPGQLGYDGQVDGNASAETNLCWIVRSEHVPSLRLLVQPVSASDGSKDVWFTLSPSD